MIQTIIYLNHRYLKSIIFISIILFSELLLFGQEAKKIEIVNTDILRVGELGPDVQILVGHVVLKHDSALMFCDSAHYNSKENNFTAYGKIHVQSPTEDMQDTVHLWGESLDYIGKNRLAMVRKNVVLKKDSMTLYTQDLDYDIAADIGKYLTGGKTINGEDTLVSKRGYFYANEDEIFFKEKVRIYNPKYTIYSDTLKHNTKKKVSYILGPTNIISTDTSSSFLYCENGFYNHLQDYARFQKNAYMVHGNKTLRGDSLFYDRKHKIGKAYNNVRAIDSTQNAILIGDYGEYKEISKSSLMTKNAVFIQAQKEDSLFLHADTLLSMKDSLITKTDTAYFDLIKGFHKVKMYKSDFQAKCDSLLYTTLDSTISLFYKPVLWSGENQITSDFIKVFTKNNEINEVRMFNNSIIISQSDTIRFDQIKGKDMIAYVSKGQLTKVDVKEEGGSIYYGRDNGKLVGVNKIACRNMIIYLDSNKVEKVWFYENPDATLYPPFYLEPGELLYENFQWLVNYRPKNKDEIFIWESKEANSKGENNENNPIKGKEEKSKKIKIEDGKEKPKPENQKTDTKTNQNKVPDKLKTTNKPPEKSKNSIK
jgi:lipopolysaccharide export system protein LptA